MQIEAGKYYRTRDGRKVGPMYRTNIGMRNMAWNDRSCGVGWTNDGCEFNHLRSKNDLIAEWTDEPMIKLEVGKTYELNNGDIVTCTEMHGDDPLSVDKFGYGPFVINGVFYHQDGRFAERSASHEYSVKREVGTSNFTLSTSTIDAIAIDSLKFHYATEMEPLQKEAFRIVMRYYGVSV